MVEIACNEESITVDFVFPTTNVGNVGFGDDIQLGITGTEAVLQVVREIIVGFKWEQDALGRSKQSFRSNHESLQKNLENLSTERIMETMTQHDERFLSINVDDVNDITLDEAKLAVMSQMLPSNLEISMAGDFDVVDVLDMVKRYLGSIPEDTNQQYKQAVEATPSMVPLIPVPGKYIELELEDPDPRAVAYVAGSAPNSWGYLSDGTTVAQRVLDADKKASEYDKKRRSHPLFAHVALSLLSEIINRRLFSTVRERRQLTYDANFSFTNFERLAGGWFLVTVTASKEKAQLALEAARRRLQPSASPKSSQLTTLSRLQEESIPLKGPLSVTDFHAVVESITARDLQLTLETLGLDEADLYTAIGKTIPPAGSLPVAEDDLVRQAPVIGMRRGGALTG
ncbi:metalloendopeptidase [Fragilaria crotonensis]|nr:metalloendopeptidase [Fragilaria crotonensis]